MRLPVIVLLLFGCSACYGLKSDVLYKPNGDYPYFYDEGPHNHVINLDEETFNDTVFNNDLPIVVEIYRDWCGDCRNLRPKFHEFARTAQNWNSTILVAAMNCADSHNRIACVNTQKNGLNETNDYGYHSVPSIKLFPAHSTNYSDLIEVDPDQSDSARADRSPDDLRYFVANMTRAYCNLSSTLQRRGVFLHNDKLASSGNPLNATWNVVNDTGTEFVVFVVTDGEDGGLNGTAVAHELALDFLPYVPKLLVVDALTYPSDLPNINVPDPHPVAVLYARGSDIPLLVANLDQSRYNVSISIIENAKITPKLAQANVKEDTLPLPVANITCDKNPDECKELFFVSEVDMLKAMRQLVLDETLWFDTIDNATRPGQVGTLLANMTAFVALLVDYFPKETRIHNGTTEPLPNSVNAKKVFAGLLKLMHDKSSITYEEWNSTFREYEKENGNPFPPHSRDWDHCHGSTRILRGFTCGVWQTFHSLTINYYLAHQNVTTGGNESDVALVPLKTIRKWIDGFFGCTHCRGEFHNMTYRDFPMDSTNVKTLEDSFLYLWRAHNYVNERLHGTPASEDPQFVKEVFPPKYLCPDCYTEYVQFNFTQTQPDFKKVKTFLLDYFPKIKPYEP